jgi:phosphoribosyl-AMP cyclohydrolase / phosphoribosyl-ATP pyrophosphohydrolase
MDEKLIANVDWSKIGGLLPAVVQDSDSAEVLMLGYMNEAALRQSMSSGLVTFFSRSKQRLWTKGETSGNSLRLQSMRLDCDHDSLLVMVKPTGPTCHNGTTTCFGEFAGPALAFIGRLEKLIAQRDLQRPTKSYTTSLFEEGVKRIAQKVGEEGLETALAAVADTDDALRGEAADLLFHLLVLLRAKGQRLEQVIDILQQRHNPK